MVSCCWPETWNFLVSRWGHWCFTYNIGQDGPFWVIIKQTPMLSQATTSAVCYQSIVLRYFRQLPLLTIIKGSLASLNIYKQIHSNCLTTCEILDALKSRGVLLLLLIGPRFHLRLRKYCSLSFSIAWWLRHSPWSGEMRIQIPGVNLILHIPESALSYWEKEGPFFWLCFVKKGSFRHWSLWVHGCESPVQIHGLWRVGFKSHVSWHFLLSGS